MGSELSETFFLAWDVWRRWLSLMLKVLETFLEVLVREAGGWCLLMWMCLWESTSLQLSLLCRFPTMSAPFQPCVSPLVLLPLWTLRPHDRLPHQALQEGVCLCLHVCVQCQKVMMMMMMVMMPLPLMPSASLLQPPWRWSPGCNPTRCREKERV